jgi:hypothetical protein
VIRREHAKRLGSVMTCCCEGGSRQRNSFKAYKRLSLLLGTAEASLACPHEPSPTIGFARLFSSFSTAIKHWIA